MGLTFVHDVDLSHLIRAGFHAEVTTFEMSGTNLGMCPFTFRQVLRVLIRMRGPARRSMVLIGLQATGLEDHHFLRIIDAVSELGQRFPPAKGHAPERLELLDVSCARSIRRACDQANTALVQMLIREETLNNLTKVCKASGLDLRHTPETVCSIASFRRPPP